MTRTSFETRKLLDEYISLARELNSFVKETDRILKKNEREQKVLIAKTKDATIQVESVRTRVREIGEKVDAGEISHETAKAIVEELGLEIERHKETQAYFERASETIEHRIEVLRNRMSIARRMVEDLKVLGERLNKRADKIPKDLNRASIWNWVSIGLAVLSSTFSTFYLAQSQKGASSVILSTSVLVVLLSTVGIYQSSRTKARAKSELNTIQTEFANLMENLSVETKS